MTPKVGDTRTVVKFAFLPTKCQERYVWLKKYHETQRLESFMAPVVINGMILGHVRNTSWEMIERIHPENIITLSNQDFDKLADAINNPKPPNEALIKARQRYEQMKKDSK